MLFRKIDQTSRPDRPGKFLLCFCFVFILSQGLAFSGSRDKVSLKLQGAPLRTALKLLSEQTTTDIVYSDELVDNIIVSCDFENIPLKQALKEILRDTPIAFKIFMNEQIALFWQSPKNKIAFRGRVLDGKTGLPLENVNVFIAYSMLGGATNKNGEFFISNVPLGTYDLVVSRIGYAVKKSKISISGPIDETLVFRLTPQPYQAPEIEVSAAEMKRWRKNLKKFTKLFFSTTPNASKCKILNPTVLDFTRKRSVFTAVAQEPLIIENRALGYKLYYVLQQFESSSKVLRYQGIPKFEELTPATTEEEKKWQKNRLRAYKGSLRHFLATIIKNYDARIAGMAWVHYEGFDVLQVVKVRPFEFSMDGGLVNTNRLLSRGKLANERVLSFPDALRVWFRKEIVESNYVNSRFGLSSVEPGSIQESLIVLNTESLIVDASGYFYDPLGVTVYGYWAWERIAEQLPLDYTAATAEAGAKAIIREKPNQANGQSQNQFLENVYNEETFFALLDSCDSNIFKSEFEYPFLVLLDVEEKDFYKSLSSPEQRKRYLKLFWDKSNPNPILPENELLNNFISRYRFVKQKFSYSRPPYFDDRGKYYLKYGPPDQRYTDGGGIRRVSLFEEPYSYREISALYGYYGFGAPAGGFNVRPNETWVYKNVNSNDALINFVREGRYFREGSLTQAVSGGRSGKASWYWAELIKDREGLTPELSFLASDIRSLEDDIRNASTLIAMAEEVAILGGVALPVGSITAQVPDLRGQPHRKLTGFRIIHEFEERVIKEYLPIADLEPDKTRNQLRFSNDVAQFRGLNGMARLKITMFAPIATDSSSYVQESLDTLHLGYRTLLRDHLFNPQSEISKQTKFPLRYALLKGIDKVTETLETFSPPGITELTLQIDEMGGARIGYTKKSIRVRDFSGSQPMISDIRLLKQVLDSALLPALPSEEMQGFLFTPYDALAIQQQVPVFCYFEIYNFNKAKGDGDIEISYTIRTETKDESFLTKLTKLFKGADESSLSLSDSKTVTADKGKELISLDVRNLKKGEYILEITVRSKKDENITVSAKKIISIVE